MNIWIDLANSPHVIFFHPLISQLEKEGHRIFVTMRDFAQTVPLARTYGINGTVIGKHGGANAAMKCVNLLNRTSQLISFAKDKSIDIAVSHNSYTHVLAGRLIGARVITLMDYEGQPANHLAFRGAHKIIVPASFPDEALRRFGASLRKVYKYQGFKEQLYLSDFEPDENFPQKIAETCERGLTPQELASRILVTVRTPATMALYHHFQNPLFEKLLALLNDKPEVIALILPRTAAQGTDIRSRFPNLVIPEHPLEGRNLIHFSDLVISAGGTMNREAAVLGTPAYSIFFSAIPAVDQELIRMGRMFHISNESGLENIRFEKKKQGEALKNPKLIEEITFQILG